MSRTSVVDVEDDGVRFDAESVVGERITEDAGYEGVRIKFTGFLGKARIPMQIDLGFDSVDTTRHVPMDKIRQSAGPTGKGNARGTHSIDNGNLSVTI